MPFYNDTWIFLWNTHAVRAALLAGEDPFSTSRVFHPEGVSLAFHTLAPLYGALALPLEPLLGLVATHNLFFLLAFWSTALSAWWLAWKLTGSAGAALLAGVLFAFSPFHQAHAPHLNLLSLQFLPLTAWAVLRFLATASRRHAVAMAASAALSFYVCHEYALISALLALLMLGHALLTRGRGSVALAAPRALAWRALLAFFLTLALILPGIVPLLAEALVESPPDEGVDIDFSADLLSWFTPSVLHSLWGGYTMKVYQHFPGVLAEWTTFLGITPCLLALFALRHRAARPSGVWLTLAAGFGLLAMGPALRVLGTALPVPLPYRLLEGLPLLGVLREPSRFAAGVTLATAMLAAQGYAALVERGGRRWALLALPLVLLEFVQVPLPTSSATPPAALARLAADGEDYAVLDVPSSLAFREHLYHQTVHGKRILLGYIARIPAASRRFLDTTPLLTDPALWQLDPERPGEAAPGERYVRLARALGVRYACVHQEFYLRQRTPERFEAAIANLARLPGARLVAREPGFALLRIDGR